jgi:hypothetical protein
MTTNDVPNSEREKTELIEEALLMNLIFSLDAESVGCSAEVAPPAISSPRSERVGREAPGLRD